MKPGRRLKELLSRYGRLALLIWVVVWLVVLGAFFVALEFGWNKDGEEGRSVWTNLLAAWALAQATYPARLAALALLVPLLDRIRPKPGALGRGDEGQDEAATSPQGKQSSGEGEDTEASPSLG